MTKVRVEFYSKDGEVLPVPVDYRLLAESERARLTAIAEREISDKKTDLLLGIINDGEKEMLKLWRIYIRNLKGIDFNLIHDKSSFDSIKWPCEPENTH